MRTSNFSLGICLALALAACRDRPEAPATDPVAAPVAAPMAENPPRDIPKGMVYIPGGRFLMGGKSVQAEPDELPHHRVRVSGFLMDQAEVTNRQFEAFVAETGYVTTAERPVIWEEIKAQLPPGTPKPPDSVLQPGSLVFRATDGPVDLRDLSQWWAWTIRADWKHPQGPDSDLEGLMDHPVVHVSHEDARAYAEWAGKRLPTEAEWEWASMGGRPDPKYPWGDVPIGQAADRANFWQGIFPFRNDRADGYYGTAPVRSYPPNGYGLYDMAGNVWEWCADKYRHDAYGLEQSPAGAVNPQGPATSFDPAEPLAEKFVIRGGSYLCSEDYCSGYRVSRRMRSTPDSAFGHTGFRCVRDL